jgi:DMSO/TMAO reductase YedYZ molybdopterin-dependent catalytic subunit
MPEAKLRITGAVNNPGEVSFANLAATEPSVQINDISQVAEGRKGDAVTLHGLLKLVGVKPEARWLTLHASADNFHASIPLDQVREKALLIYRLNGEPLPAKSGGPFRFFIPDYLACRSADIDECANVKFVDHIELSVERGLDNRPHDDAAHEALHANEGH